MSADFYGFLPENEAGFVANKDGAARRNFTGNLFKRFPIARDFRRGGGFAGVRQGGVCFLAIRQLETGRTEREREVGGQFAGLFGFRQFLRAFHRSLAFVGGVNVRRRDLRLTRRNGPSTNEEQAGPTGERLGQRGFHGKPSSSRLRLSTRGPL